MTPTRVTFAMCWAGLASAAHAPTFSKDVAPILYKRCLECHRAGEVAPMSFLTYKEVRPWAKSIKERVVTRSMPPWHADPSIGKFSNDRRLSDAEVASIVSWVDAGAPEGNPADLWRAPEFPEGWRIGKPDLVLDTGVDFKIPAAGVLPYRSFLVDPGFTEDTWIQAAEFRPSKRAHVHHAQIDIVKSGDVAAIAGDDFSAALMVYLPGMSTFSWDPDTAFLFKAGWKLVFRIHYTTDGKEGVDRSAVGLKVRKTMPKFWALIDAAQQWNLKIPPDDPNYETKAAYPFKEDATLLDLTPHMHLRGKAFQYVLIYPDGRRELLLSIPRYDFNWQTRYILAEPRHVPAGSILEATAWYDNSINNKFNPAPWQTVRWGQQTFQEMMFGVFGYRVPTGGRDRPDPSVP